MNNIASTLVLIFLAITFVMSAHEKVFHWKDSLAWLIPHFENSVIKNFVPLFVFILTSIELVAGVLCAAGVVQMHKFGSNQLGFYGAVFSCVAILFMLIGQRLAKDYDGARNMIIYFIPAVLAVYWLG